MIKLPPFNKDFGKEIRTIDIEGHKPTHASVFLLWYSKPTSDIKNACELGSGTGFVTFGLSKYYGLNSTGVELQKELYENSLKAIKLNNLNNVKFFNLDVKNIKEYFKAESFDMVVFNPPYHLSSNSPNIIRRVTRKGSNELLESFVSAAAYLLRNRGTFVSVISPYVLPLFNFLLLKYKLTPQQMCIGYSKKAELVAIRGRKNGGLHLEIDKPIFF